MYLSGYKTVSSFVQLLDLGAPSLLQIGSVFGFVVAGNGPTQLIGKSTFFLQYHRLGLVRLVNDGGFFHSQASRLFDKEPEGDEIGYEQGDIDKVEFPCDRGQCDGVDTGPSAT